VSPLLLHVFSTFAPGGPQVRTVRLIEALGGAFRHRVVALDGNTLARDLLSGEAEVGVLPAPPRAGTLRTVGAVRAILLAERADLLLTYNWGAIEAVLAAHVSGHRAILHHEDGFRPDEVAGFKRRRVLARRAVLRGTRGVVVPSRTLEGIALDTWKLPAELVRYVPNGIDVDAFPLADGHGELRARLGIPPDAVVVGSVGHLRAEKNPARLVRALAAMQAPDVHLLLLGEGPERGVLEDARRGLPHPERVHLVGHQAAPQDHYRAMDVFALSSDTEQMPVAELEAMACGLPVVGTDVGDVRSVLPPDQARFVVPLAGDATAGALARALDELARDRELRRRLGAENRRWVEARYSFEGMREAYRELWSGALARAR